MINCKEYSLYDLLSITAIPIAKYTPAGTTMLVSVIASENFNPTVDSSAIVIAGSASVGSLIPIKASTCKAKDSETDNVAGRLHTVNVNCEIDDRDADVWTTLQRLEQTPSHLILTSRDNTRFFVQGAEDTYLCSVERDGEKTTVTIKMQCMMGLQRIEDVTTNVISNEDTIVGLE